jgi:hypothetical protein
LAYAQAYLHQGERYSYPTRKYLLDEFATHPTSETELILGYEPEKHLILSVDYSSFSYLQLSLIQPALISHQRSPWQFLEIVFLYNP